MGEIFRFEMMFTNRALHELMVSSDGDEWPCCVETATGFPGDQRRHDQRDSHGDKMGQSLRINAQYAGVADDAYYRGRQHGTNPDRVDVVQVGTFELNVCGTKPQWFVDHQIRHQRTNPGNGDDAIETQGFLQRPVNTQFHHQKGNGDVEKQPDNSSGVAVGESREEVGPGDGAGIGIGNVDLELAKNDENARHRQRDLGRMGNVIEGDQIHLGGISRLRGGNALFQGKNRKKGARQDFQHADHNPARSACHNGGPPTSLFPGIAGFWNEAQEIHLLADLGNQ